MVRGQARGAPTPPHVSSTAQHLFYPAWEVLPHEARLPHADVISERLETLVTLTRHATDNTPHAPLIVTSVTALLQRTFPAGAVRERTRTLTRGDRVDPLDLVEWLEAQGYEPEAQVTQKGEIALRGGILDVYPLTSPWPVRAEFFGDELESLRQFDPLTQMSREEITAVSIPPAGELGLLKKSEEEGENPKSDTRNPRFEIGALGTLLDYLSPGTVFLLCEPDQLAERADEYARQVPEGDPFFIPWGTFLEQVVVHGMTRLELTEAESGLGGDGERETSSDAQFPLTSTLSPGEREKPSPAGGEFERGGTYSDVPTLSPLPEGEGKGEGKGHVPNVATPDLAKAERPPQCCPPSAVLLRRTGYGGRVPRTPHFESLEAFRPLAERAPEPQVAEVQRREFFAQLHRWLRQGYAVHVFCNNDGEQQRFTEIWHEYGFTNVGQASRLSPPPRDDSDRNASTIGLDDVVPESEQDRRDACPTLHLGTLARGFLCDEAGLVVVTDAEIFGRHKVQRARRLKSPHAQATRSALDIDFTELEEGDYVVHLQHGIGRYVGLQVLPAGAGTKPTEGSGANAHAGQECLVIEYASSDPAQPPPKLYVPVTEAHLVSKYVGTGKARPPLNTLGGSRWAKAKAHAERAVRDVAGDLLAIQAARESQPGHPFAPDAPWQREFESAFIFEETPDQERAIIETKADMERPKPMDRLICGDVGFGKTEVGIRAAFKAVMDGKQVAVLVPTTVLAQQHYNTFRERMADYPIRVELLSRFRTRGAQQAVVRDLAAGVS